MLAQTKTGEIEKYVDSWGFGDMTCKRKSGSTLGLLSHSSSKGLQPPVTTVAERPQGGVNKKVNCVEDSLSGFQLIFPF